MNDIIDICDPVEPRLVGLFFRGVWAAEGEVAADLLLVEEAFGWLVGAGLATADSKQRADEPLSSKGKCRDGWRHSKNLHRGSSQS